ncbi:hypothetical protein [Ectopseudomonas hydrolytica]|uniref:hypothetical protein n=1 Tax=Ectopseudomonas hydrolytica TaxID=2493633 RepID=UPI00376EF767
MTNPNKAELRRLCDEIENCGGIARLMKGGLFSSWIELVSPSSVRALLDECDRLQATCGGLDRQNDAIAEEIGKVTAERDAALAELEACKSQLRALIHISDATGWERHTCGEIAKARALLAKEASNA